MATINHMGNISARCPSCQDGVSTFEWASSCNAFGNVSVGALQLKSGHSGHGQHRLYRCAGCGIGALAFIALRGNFPTADMELLNFYRETAQRLKLPAAVPEGIRTEYEEAELCMGHGALRAAAGLLRSVLDKTLRANGYKLKPGTTLEQQIDLAGSDGIITAARVRRAHDEVRVLGNDVLHDEWRAIPIEDVAASHHYVQRILEDFYDERESTLKVLIEKKRLSDEGTVA